MPHLFPQTTSNREGADAIISDLPFDRMHSSDLEGFKDKLRRRVTEFKSILENPETDPAEKHRVLEQYRRFARCLKLCIEHPEDADFYINRYMTFQYYPVAVHDIAKPNETLDSLAPKGPWVFLALLVGAAIAIPFSLPLSIALAAIATTVLTLSVFYQLSPDSLDTEPKKSFERALFLEAANSMKSEANIDESKTPTPVLQ